MRQSPDRLHRPGSALPRSVLGRKALGISGWRLFRAQLQRWRQITTGVQDSPDVDRVIGDDVEHDVREALQWPGSKLWDRELVREVKRAHVGAATDSLDTALDSVDELERRLLADLQAVVVTGSFKVGCREFAE